MNYVERLPGPPLSEYIERLWYFDSLDLPHTRERVLPDGGFELVINLQDEPRKLFDRHDSSRYELFRRGWISGAHFEHLVIDVLRGSSLMGVHFRPGGAPPFLRMPADELTSRVVDLEAVWGSGAWTLRDQLRDTVAPQAKIRLLERYLAERLARAAPSPQHRQRLEFALGLLDGHQSRTRAVCAQLGISQKHFIDQFRAQVGLTPKRFSRIRRFQRVLAQIGSKQQIDWAGVVYDCGYYDQAHFINDFQAFSGVSPSDYLRVRLEYPNFTSAD